MLLSKILKWILTQMWVIFPIYDVVSKKYAQPLVPTTGFDIIFNNVQIAKLNQNNPWIALAMVVFAIYTSLKQQTKFATQSFFYISIMLTKNGCGYVAHYIVCS